MASATLSSAPSVSRKKGLHVALWVVQGLLAAAFFMAGFQKLGTPIADLVASGMAFAGRIPEGLVRFIGVAEMTGAVGLILPSALRVLPKLSALAGAGLATVMALAAVHHLMHGEASMLPVNLFLGGLAAFVAWGRSVKAPIAPKR